MISRRFEFPTYNADTGQPTFNVRLLGENESMRAAVNGLDEGIIPLVEALTDLGFLTFASCQGGAEHSSPYPWVRVRDDNDPAKVCRGLREAMLTLGYKRFRIRFEMMVVEYCDTDWIEVRLLEPVRHYHEAFARDLAALRASAPPRENSPPEVQR